MQINLQPISRKVKRN